MPFFSRKESAASDLDSYLKSLSESDALSQRRKIEEEQAEQVKRREEKRYLTQPEIIKPFRTVEKKLKKQFGEYGCIINLPDRWFMPKKENPSLDLKWDLKTTQINMPGNISSYYTYVLSATASRNADGLINGVFITSRKNDRKVILEHTNFTPNQIGSSIEELVLQTMTGKTVPAEQR